MKTYKAAIFDMDGTLTNTLADLYDSVNEMLAHYDFPRRTLDEVRQFVGNGARKLITRSLPADKEGFIDEALKYYDGCYARNCLKKVRPYEGIMDLLATLEAKKIPLGICTNKQHFAAVAITEKILAPIKFFYVSGDEPGQPRKPNPTRALAGAKSFGVEPEDVAYFGDTAVDIQTAINAGFLPVGVTWGFRPRSELVESGAEIIIDHPLEIFDRINFGGN
ncbi:MAG: HAD-IA family hydrolase [Selenomonadaceae bacterium]|nr:HAD-IA family hydrolase [Selenomonadaceae bacterium]